MVHGGSLDVCRAHRKAEVRRARPVRPATDVDAGTDVTLQTTTGGVMAVDILAGDSVFTVRTRAFQTDADIGR